MELGATWTTGRLTCRPRNKSSRKRRGNELGATKDGAKRWQYSLEVTEKTVPGTASIQVLCEPDWTLKGRSCYKLTTSELTWSEAQEDCRSMNSLLAEVKNARQQRALNGFLNSRESRLFGAWIGLRDQRKDKNWTWGSGPLMNYSNWYDSEPNNKGGNEYCVNVWPRESGKWNDYSCTATFQGVCQKGFCDEGWTATRMSCYQLTEAATREAARAKCQSMHGSLVEISDSHEQEELHDFLKSQDAYKVWIGLSNRGKDRAWQWDSGSHLMYNKWIPGEPNNAGGEEYCVNVWQQNDYEWNDDACHKKYPAVCKQHNGSRDENSTSSGDTVSSIGGGTVAAVVCISVGALVTVVITIYLCQRKPWKKHRAEEARDGMQLTQAHPNLNETTPLQEHHLRICCDGVHRTSEGLHERMANFTNNDEDIYEEIPDHTQNTYCHLYSKPSSPTSTYETPLDVP